MEFDFSVLAVYLTPILSAIGVLITAILKIKELISNAGLNIKTSISDASKQLQDENNYKPSVRRHISLPDPYLSVQILLFFLKSNCLSSK